MNSRGFPFFFWPLAWGGLGYTYLHTGEVSCFIFKLPSTTFSKLPLVWSTQQFHPSRRTSVLYSHPIQLSGHHVSHPGRQRHRHRARLRYQGQLLCFSVGRLALGTHSVRRLVLVLATARADDPILPSQQSRAYARQLQQYRRFKRERDLGCAATDQH